VPVRLRIVSYDHDPDAPPGFPTIIVEGEMGGENWNPEVTSDSQNDIRLVSGTVSLLYDGNVRWSFVTSFDTGELEWLSEGVQIGGIGSITGILGLWTSAERQGDDPIGAWWQWKVA